MTVPCWTVEREQRFESLRRRLIIDKREAMNVASNQRDAPSSLARRMSYSHSCTSGQTSGRPSPRFVLLRKRQKKRQYRHHNSGSAAAGTDSASRGNRLNGHSDLHRLQGRMYGTMEINTLTGLLRLCYTWVGHAHGSIQDSHTERHLSLPWQLLPPHDPGRATGQADRNVLSRMKDN